MIDLLVPKLTAEEILDLLGLAEKAVEESGNPEKCACGAQHSAALIAVIS